MGFFDELVSEGREVLLGEIESLELSRTYGSMVKYLHTEDLALPEGEIKAAEYYRAVCVASEVGDYAEARSLGERLLSEGKVAGFVVAGGQGTRLGFGGPKGDYPVSPLRQKTLFCLFAESLRALQAKYGSVIPWYIMTSPLNYDATVEIFEKSGYFGLDKKDVFIFVQGTLPNFDFGGKILMAEKGRIACSPDGHGGSLSALYRSGAVAEMRARGVEYISYWQVDNPLVRIMDPLFIGLHAMKGAEMSSKALKKRGAGEKVGNFCSVDGKVTVIEYSDLPDEYAERRNADGSLCFELGSIAIHMISRSFVELLNRDGFSLPLHRAVKKIGHIDADGKEVIAEEPNGVKLESFIFDALPMAEKSIILETIRADEFGPVKNAEGEDSVGVTRGMMIERAAKWLEEAGVSVPRKSDGTVDAVIEIAASFAVDAEDVKRRAAEIPTIERGSELYLE